MEHISEQELHKIAMNHVGKDLESKGFQFIAINSQLQKHPQFICVDAQNDLYFVMVQAVPYPINPEIPNRLFVETFLDHAKNKNAKVLFAGVGIANAENIEEPIYLSSDYVINYNGFKKIT
ncbi:Na(+)-translocating NADH-quinone reductase subunit F [uncultured Flavobacterium sp.]|uniref:Na(+)-translocating NADH-quinone reductase subunit F n=1 Tax=uncultured Flavobacterium sp. TaxID=165435 RepID=UPI0030CA3B9C|tara:strand:- start:1016 stop:1378 length:363 start_codon:yes stop_codon:yes gene_type:complete